MKQTVEETAIRYTDIMIKDNGGCQYDFVGADIKDAFIAGAEWQARQSPWINVEGRLPEENTGVFFTVEWKDSHKGYFVGLYCGNGQWESEHRIFLKDSPLYRITHYMPIPTFDQILEANKDVLQRMKEKGD